jgi:hypothetical protein
VGSCYGKQTKVSHLNVTPEHKFDFLPREMKDQPLKDLVYDERAGKAGDGTWIYVIDGGVAYGVNNVCVWTLLR